MTDKEIIQEGDVSCENEELIFNYNPNSRNNEASFSIQEI